MSLNVKLTFGPEPPVRVSYEAIEAMTGLTFPWVQQNDDGSKATYYGLCPACGNAMRLVTPFQTLNQAPHGRHVLEHVPGFAYDLEKIPGCDRFRGATSSAIAGEGETAVITPKGRQVRDFMTQNADFASGILTEDIGISASLKLIATLYRTFFGNLLYLRPNITTGNAPWLLSGSLRTYPVYGQIVRRNSDTVKAIRRGAPKARLGTFNRLESMPGNWIDIRFSLLRHRISGEDPPRETIDLVIASHEKNKTVRPLLEKTIYLRTAAFLKRVETRPPPNPKGRKIIEVARKQLQRHIAEHPHLK